MVDTMTEWHSETLHKYFPFKIIALQQTQKKRAFQAMNKPIR